MLSEEYAKRMAKQHNNIMGVVMYNVGNIAPLLPQLVLMEERMNFLHKVYRGTGYCQEDKAPKQAVGKSSPEGLRGHKICFLQ